MYNTFWGFNYKNSVDEDRHAPVLRQCSSFLNKQREGSHCSSLIGLDGTAQQLKRLENTDGGN